MGDKSVAVKPRGNKFMLFLAVFSLIGLLFFGVIAISLLIKEEESFGAEPFIPSVVFLVVFLFVTTSLCFTVWAIGRKTKDGLKKDNLENSKEKTE